MDDKLDATLNAASLRITNEILLLIAEIDEFKGAWRAIGRIAPERLSDLRRVATIESIGSSTRIDGAKLTDREVEQLLSNIEIRSFRSCRAESLADSRQTNPNDVSGKHLASFAAKSASAAAAKNPLVARMK